MRTDRRTVKGRVVGPAGMPRSYFVETPTGEVRRNQAQLTVTPGGNTQTGGEGETNQRSTETEQSRRIVTRSHTGTHIRPPDRYGL